MDEDVTASAGMDQRFGIAPTGPLDYLDRRELRISRDNTALARRMIYDQHRIGVRWRIIAQWFVSAAAGLALVMLFIAVVKWSGLQREGPLNYLLYGTLAGGSGVAVAGLRRAAVWMWCRLRNRSGRPRHASPVGSEPDTAEPAPDDKSRVERAGVLR